MNILNMFSFMFTHTHIYIYIYFFFITKIFAMTLNAPILFHLYILLIRVIGLQITKIIS